MADLFDFSKQIKRNAFLSGGGLGGSFNNADTNLDTSVHGVQRRQAAGKTAVQKQDFVSQVLGEQLNMIKKKRGMNGGFDPLLSNDNAPGQSMSASSTLFGV